MSDLALSVFVIARNEEARLGRTLAAVQFADEIVLADSGSTDATCAIAEAAGARVLFHAWQGYGAQKVFAERACRHDWVLNVDADEVVTPALAEEIAAVVRANRPGVWRVRILNVYPGDARPRPLANDYNVVRLYHRSLAGYRDHPLFDRVESAERPGQLRNPIHHHPFTSWAHFVDKENRYSTFAAEAARPRKRWRLMIRLPVEFPVSFLKFYIARGHFLGGWKGLVFSIVAATARMLRIAKMLERAGGKEKSQSREKAC